MGPHEIVLIENGLSEESWALASAYARLRGVPEANRISVDLAPPGDGRYDLTPEAFTERIWEPVNRAIRERGLEGHILAWVYSAGFPVLVTTRPAMSLTGLTWVRNRPPPAEEVEKGSWNSPLFAGPARPGAAISGTRTLDVARDGLGDEMPLPSMMLGYIGAFGNTREEVLRTWHDPPPRARPDAAIWFVTNSDIRSVCRDWQFAGAAKELQALGVPVRIAAEWPARGQPLLGLMTGRVTVDPQSLTLSPGAIGDHLTSFAGAFEETGQTRIDAWIRAGACAAAGTVTEPMSIAAKFPNGRLYVHLARGVTVLEAYALAVKCPLQLLILGDPLAAPWSGGPAAVRIDGLKAGAALDAPARIRLESDSRFGPIFTRHLFLVDGVPLGKRAAAAEVVLDPARLAPGRHLLRGVGYGAGTIRRQGWTEIEFEVAPPARPGGG